LGSCGAINNSQTSRFHLCGFFLKAVGGSALAALKLSVRLERRDYRLVIA
jgi:hypothetical protein